MAGFALQLVPEDPAPRAKEAYTESIEMLRAFVEAYPAHEKSPRAETMMGVLYYKTGRYLEAINLLGDPERRLRDPGAYLTALRTLGRSYAAVNQVDNARSAFMRAGALESNMAPDEDYAELAGLYTQLAERSGDPAQRRWYFAQAVEQWDFALQVPGLLKSRKDDMKLLRDVAAGKADDEFAGVSNGAQTPRGRLRPPGQNDAEQRGGAPSAGD
jgi:tetratricopeptide (TPR) repeat protein